MKKPFGSETSFAFLMFISTANRLIYICFVWREKFVYKIGLKYPCVDNLNGYRSRTLCCCRRRRWSHANHRITIDASKWIKCRRKKSKCRSNICIFTDCLQSPRICDLLWFDWMCLLSFRRTFSHSICLFIMCNAFWVECRLFVSCLGEQFLNVNSTLDT